MRLRGGLTHSSALIAHDSLDAVVARRGTHAIDARQFLREVAALAERLPRCGHVLNVCADRYRFAVGFAACLVSGRVSLLPATRTPEVIQRLKEIAPDVICLTDESRCDLDLPRWRYPETPLRTFKARTDGEHIPDIADDQVAAMVFTSGSTGVPQPYRKSWGRLVRCVRGAAAQLGMAAPYTLIGTVPPQHMYGLESTVLLALQGGHALTADRPFYPADVCAAIDASPRPRALITTPIHLRALLAAGLGLPALDLLVSATAPLSQECAQEAERRFGCPLLEIYGSTETGQIATRRTAETAAFRCWPDVTLRLEHGLPYAEGGHIEQRTALCDIIETQGSDRFLLKGRTADLVNVAGKRSSIGYLDAQLHAVPGVIDGAFFWPEDAGEGITGVARLAAAVVAPGLTAAELTLRLRERIDPVFLPRPLLLVERLPRNATGKLPLQSLKSLAAMSPASPRGR